MPTYRYHCPKCGVEKTIFRSMNDTSDVICECGAKMQRVFTSVPIIYKSLGFYNAQERKKIEHYEAKYNRRKKKREV